MMILLFFATIFLSIYVTIHVPYEWMRLALYLVILITTAAFTELSLLASGMLVLVVVAIFSEAFWIGGTISIVALVTELIGAPILAAGVLGVLAAAWLVRLNVRPDLRYFVLIGLINTVVILPLSTDWMNWLGLPLLYFLTGFLAMIDHRRHPTLAYTMQHHWHRQQPNSRREALMSLRSISTALRQKQELSLLLRNALSFVTEISQTSHGIILLRDLEKDLLECHNATGIFEQFSSPITYNESFAEKLAQETSVVVLSEEDFVDDFPTGMFKSVICLPLKSGENVLGVVVVASENAGRLSDESRLFLEHVVDLAAIAIENSHLYQAAHRELAERLKTERLLNSKDDVLEVLHEMSLMMTRALPGDKRLRWVVDAAYKMFPDISNVTVQIMDQDQEIATTAFTHMFDVNEAVSFKPGSGIAGHVIESGKTINVPDVTLDDRYIRGKYPPRYRSMLVSPMIVGDHIWGTVSIASETVGAFDDLDQRLLELLSQQVGIILETINLYEKERAQRQIAEAIQNVMAIINSIMDLETLFDRIILLMQAVIPSDAMTIMMLQDNKKIVFVGGKGRYQKLYDHLDKYPTFELDTLPTLKHMRETGQPLQIAFTKQSSLWNVRDLPTHWVESYLGAPLISDGELIGFINFDSKQPGFFKEEHVNVVRTFAGQLAIAIRKIQLLEAERRQHEIAEILREIGMVLARTMKREEIFEKIIEQVGRVVPFVAAGLWLKNEYNQWYMAYGTGYDQFGLQEDMYSKVYDEFVSPDMLEMKSTLQPVIVPNFDNRERLGSEFSWLNSWAGVPLVVRGEFVGKLALDHTEPNFYKKRHVPILEALSTQISIAIENARLFDAEQKQRQIAETLREIGMELSSSLTLTEILPRILEQAARVIDYTTAGIWLKGDDGLWGMQFGTGYEKYSVANLMYGERIAHLDQRPLNYISAEGGPVTKPHYKAIHERFKWIKSWAGAPLVVNGELIGMLAMDHVQPGFYAEHHHPLLAALASQISIAIKNARLFEAEQKQRRLADTLREVGLVLSSSLDLDEIMARVLEEAARVIEYDAAGIWLKGNDGRWRLAHGVGYEQFGVEKQIQSMAALPEELPSLDKLVDEYVVTILPDYHQAGNAPAGFEWLNSLASAPIIYRGEIFGTISFDHTQKGFYTEAQQPIIEALAAQISIAVENANLFRRLQSHAEALEEKVAERTTALERERAQLETILEGMAEGVIFIEYPENNVGGTIRYVNHTLYEMFNLDRTHFVDHTDHEIIALVMPEGEKEWFYKEYYAFFDTSTRPLHKKVWSFEVPVKRPDGYTFDVQANFTLLHLSESTSSVGIVLVRDISQHKQLQRQRERFLANASHELRTPLTNLKTRVYLLQHQPEQAQKHIDAIDRTVAGMSSLVNDLLSLIRLQQIHEATDIERVDVLQVLQDVIQLQRPEADLKHIRIINDITLAPIYLFGNRKHFEHLFTNIVVNAIIYTEQGGSITISGSTDAINLKINITDTGIGIAPDHQEMIFEPFFRVDDHETTGTGLGLAIAREITEIYGGKIWLESTVGTGTIFHIELPINAYPGNDTPFELVT